MISFGKKPPRIHPIVSISLTIILFTTIIGIIYIWNSINQRAGQAILIQNVVEINGSTCIYVQNVGDGTVFLELVQIDGEKTLIHENMCLIDGDYTNILPNGRTASITVEHEIIKMSKIRVIAKGGAFAVWVMPP